MFLNHFNTKEYIFTSSRLGFRNWSDDDLDEFAELNTDEEVMKYFPNKLTIEEVASLIKRLKNHYSINGFTYFATEILETNEFIGMIGLAYQEYPSEFTPAVDIGWRLKRSSWGNGYATEGASRCLQFAFDALSINRIISVCTIENKKSENVMKKIGMSKIGEFNHPSMINYPKFERHLCYAIDSHEHKTICK